MANALGEVVGKVERGERVCLQAPNGYGKSTAMRAFLQLHDTGARKDIAFAVPHPQGYEMYDYAYEGEHKVTLSSLLERGITTLVVDEAGRIEASNKNTIKLLEEAEAAGVHVVRIYPGNVTPPEGYEVVKVG